MILLDNSFTSYCPFHRSLTHAAEICKLACRNNFDNCHYMLFSNKIGIMVDHLINRLNVSIALISPPFLSIVIKHYKQTNKYSVKHVAGLPTCTDFRGTYQFWPSITISRFHAVVYRFWKMREFLGLADFVLFCFRRYSVILSASCTYRQSRRCVAAINSPPHAMNQC